MCGIGGGIGRPGDGIVGAVSSACLAAHARRGPDHQRGEVIAVGGWQAHLTHNRLTVVDLSSGGHQPMRRDPGGQWLCYNGEIYNYVELRRELESMGLVFQSASDSEVLLAAWQAWGPDSLDRCNGMFAFAIVDPAKAQVTLVRDRFGVKPLHYVLTPDRLLFSSTPGPLAAAVGGEPDLTYLSRGARYGTWDDDTGRSPFARVRSLPAGHLLSISLGQGPLLGEPRAWYRLADRVRDLVPTLASLTAEDAIAATRQQLDEAVRLRLRADVPVAVSLSGGVDSATVAAMARARHGTLRGFSFGHPDQPGTEGPVIGRLARHLDLEVDWVWPTDAVMAEDFWACLEAQDAPFAGGSVVAQHAVFRAVRRAGVKVLLGGQGGDEAFMGYRKYLVWRWLSAMRSGDVRATVGSGVDLACGLAAQATQWRTYLAAARRYRPGGAVGSLLALPAAAPTSWKAPEVPGLAAHQVADAVSGGLPTLLRYEDRNSMGNSVESRLPFLDYRLVEWAMAAPVGVKLRAGYGKWVLRQVANGLLPAEVGRTRGKRGFDVRVDRWLAAGLGERIRTRLSEARPRLRAFLPDRLRVERDFSDAALATTSQRMTDAITALWLARWT
jgi:asparagine synthase (glutamine-hydrolysing)